VASQSDIDDLNVSQNIDLKIYPNDPAAIRNKKTTLSLIHADGVPSADPKSISGSVIDLRDAPPEAAAGISALLQTYVAKRLAQAERGRPGVYRIESSLIMQITRDVGLYERDQQKRRTQAQWDEGYDVKPRSHWSSGASFDDFSDAFAEPPRFGPAPLALTAHRNADNGPTPPAAANGNAATAQNDDGNDGGGSGWSNLRGDDGGKTKKFYN
jgi:hypothetical protein